MRFASSSVKKTSPGLVGAAHTVVPSPIGMILTKLQSANFHSTFHAA